MKRKVDDFSKIEKHLKNYKKYKISIQNMKRQLDHMFPKITTAFDNKEGTTGTFTFKSDTEDYAIKRAEKKAETEWLINHYTIIIESIDSAMKQLDPIEKEFVEMKYFNDVHMKKIAYTLKTSYRTIYDIKSKVKKEFIITLKNLTMLDP